MGANEAECTVGSNSSANMATTARRAWAIFTWVSSRSELLRSRTIYLHLNSHVPEAPCGAARCAEAQLVDAHQLCSVISNPQPEKTLTTSAGFGRIIKSRLRSSYKRHRSPECLSASGSRPEISESLFAEVDGEGIRHVR
jgi:hypothetical protein